MLFRSTYNTPGWQRAQGRATEHTPNSRHASNGDHSGFSERASPYQAAPQRRGAPLIEGEVVARSTGTTSSYSEGERVFHIKFGNGSVSAVDGNKLTIDFDKAGRKMVLETFVARA